MMVELADTINAHWRQPTSPGVQPFVKVPGNMRAPLAPHLAVDMPRRESLDKIYSDWRADPDFRHLKRPSNFVPGEGPHHPAAVLIGEAPGANEDRLMRPFVGASGNFLDSMMSYAGMSRKDCFVTNVVKWRPPNNRTPTLEEVELSVPYLRREVMSVLPQGGLTVLLGAVPLGVVEPGARVSMTHGVPFNNGPWVFVPMYHPSYIMQGRGDRAAYIEDWQKIGVMIK